MVWEPSFSLQEQDAPSEFKGQFQICKDHLEIYHHGLLHIQQNVVIWKYSAKRLRKHIIKRGEYEKLLIVQSHTIQFCSSFFFILSRTSSPAGNFSKVEHKYPNYSGSHENHAVVCSIKGSLRDRRSSFRVKISPKTLCCLHTSSTAF